MFGLYFSFLGVMAIIGMYVIPNKNKWKCKKEVQATIEEVVEGNVEYNGETMYSAICSYYYNGQEYRNRVEMNVRKCNIHIGDKIMIKINSKKPEETYAETDPELKAPGYIGLFAGSIFVLIGLYVFVQDIMGNVKEVSKGEYVIVDSSSKKRIEENKVDSGQNNTQYKKNDNNKNVEENNTDLDLEKDIPYTDNYIEIYGDDYDTNLDSRLGSDVTDSSNMAFPSYLEQCTIRKEIDSMIFYLPKDFQFTKKEENTYYYEHSITKSKLSIYAERNFLGLYKSRDRLNNMANRNRILDSISERNFLNSNLYELFKARNIQGEYLDVACSANKRYMLYIEYNHKLGTENIFEDFVRSIKY